MNTLCPQFLTFLACVDPEPPAMLNFMHLLPFTEGDLHVVIETTCGSKAKFAYESRLDTFVFFEIAPHQSYLSLGIRAVHQGGPRRSRRYQEQSRPQRATRSSA
jgi:hypothetical protein